MAGNAPTEFKVVMAQKSGTDDKPADWTNNDGQKMTTWEVLLEGQNQTLKAYQNHGKGHPEPVQGEMLSGWVNADKGTFGIAAPRRGGGGKGGGYSPEDIARMSRSHAQEMALRLTGPVEAGLLEDKTALGAFLNGVVKPLTDWFDADVKRAGQAAAGGSSPPANGEVTQEQLEAASESKADADIPFRRPEIRDRTVRHRDLFVGDRWIG
jgi:hypothetical protein